MTRSGLVKRKFLSDLGEQLADILSRLSRCLKEKKSSLLGVRFSISSRDGAFIGLLGDEIQLVTSEGDDDVFISLALEFLDPSLCFIKGSLLRFVSARKTILERVSQTD